MSAPAPPPHRVPVSSQRHMAADMSHGNLKMSPNGASAGGAGKRAPMPHIRDLIEDAESRVDALASVPKLLEISKSACTNAETYVDFGRPALAYTEWVVARYIISTVIPFHKDSPSIPGISRLHSLHRDVISQLKASGPHFDKLEAQIQADNERNGVVARASAQRAQEGAPRRGSAQSNASRKGSTGGQHIVTAASEATRSPTQTRQKPPVSPKPRQFQNSPDNDMLADRFARLRASQPSSRYSMKSGPTIHSVDDGVSVNTRRPPSSFSMHESQGSHTAYSPQTPRSAADAIGKLPKLPDPTYTPGPAAPPLRPSAVSRNSYSQDVDRPASRTSILSNNGSMHASTAYTHLQDVTNGAEEQALPAPRRRRRAATNGSVELEIDANRLYDYQKDYYVLLIDLRSREEHDQGHIMTTYEMCIEPTALRPNMSAEQLQEAMVLSPDREQQLFARRDEFELVVYYDSSTQNVDFPSHSSAPQCLYETLTLYNHEKPLQRPPILLKGGIEAWVDLLGSQSLEQSNTQIRSLPNSRPMARRPAISGNDRLGVRRKRREYNPLDPEEERKWRERARSESMVVDTQILQQRDEQGLSSDSLDYDNVEQRFPDLTTFSQRHAEQHPPQRPAPQIPYYPTPQPSSYVPPPAPLPPSLAIGVQSQAHPLPATPSYSQPPPIPSRPPPAIQRPSYSGVSERIISPTAMSNQVSAQLAPYISPKLKRLPRTGLYNFGATCYMNATIQCLSATIPLTAFFIEGQFMRHIQRNSWKGSKGVMPELYANLIKNLWSSNDADTLRPTNFRSFCGRLNHEWGSTRQQDAKEFLDFLLDILHEDFNQNWEKTPLQALTEAEEAQRERMLPIVASRIEWDRYLHRDSSKMTELFAGQHISRLRCTTCGFTSTTYEAFYSISVEIPSPKSSANINIYDCLNSYCSEEKLSGDEVWRCPRCKTEREATKQIKITRVPDLLIIHFKRFSADHNERARKIHKAIAFPLEGLDLGRYVLPLPKKDKLQELPPRQRHPQLFSDANAPPFRYDAYGVVRHIGSTLASGHYKAMVRDRARRTWREFNDSRVRDFQPSQASEKDKLQNEEAYIVFYQRVHEAR